MSVHPAGLLFCLLLLASPCPCDATGDTLFVCRWECPFHLKDLVSLSKHGVCKMQGKVVGLPTQSDALGFGTWRKDKAWVRWEGGQSTWEWWSDLRPLRRSPSRAKNRFAKEASSSKKCYSQPTLFSKQGRRAAWLVLPPLPAACRYHGTSPCLPACLLARTTCPRMRYLARSLAERPRIHHPATFR